MWGLAVYTQGHVDIGEKMQIDLNVTVNSLHARPDSPEIISMSFPARPDNPEKKNLNILFFKKMF